MANWRNTNVSCPPKDVNVRVKDSVGGVEYIAKVDSYSGTWVYVLFPENYKPQRPAYWLDNR